MMNTIITNVVVSSRKVALLACLMLFVFSATFLMTGIISGYAQSDTSLEDYMKNDEPAQKALQAPAENPEEKKASLLSRLQEAIGDEEPAEVKKEEKNKNDVLPKLPDRIKIQTRGFENASGRKMFVEFDEEGERLDGQSEEEFEEGIRREAFDAAITGLFPLGPEDMKKLLRTYDTTKRIVKEPVHGIPSPQVNVATISLDPGIPPTGLKTAIGHVTTLNFLDITGAPWPIQDVSWAGDFEVIEPEEGGHILRITPLEPAAYGNMSIRLLTLKTPVTIMLRTSKDEVQYRVDARIAEYGPFAQAPLIEGGAERVAGNALITSILDGVPPGGAVRLDVSGVDGRTSAYNVNGMTYVRTPLTLLSPGWEQSVSSADGLNVYALNQTPVLLLSDKGRFMRASLKISKDLLDE